MESFQETFDKLIKKGIINTDKKYKGDQGCYSINTLSNMPDGLLKDYFFYLTLD